MADNIAVTAGSGTNVATDDIGGVHYQRTKLVWGADGTANDASAANPLPISDKALASSVGTLVRKAFGSFGTSFADQTITLTNMVFLFVDNTTDADIDLSYAGTNSNYCVRAKSARFITLLSGATTVWAKRLSAMSEGEVTFETWG